MLIWDEGLYSVFSSREALDKYAVSEAHVKVVTENVKPNVEGESDDRIVLIIQTSWRTTSSWRSRNSTLTIKMHDCLSFTLDFWPCTANSPGLCCTTTTAQTIPLDFFLHLLFLNTFDSSLGG